MGGATVTVNGRTTVYTYDKANQLVSSECNGKITKYEYDAAGRLVKEGKRSYSYSWLDKVSSVKENGVEVASFTYHMDGQIATAKANGRQENFLWDNLALISRNETEYVNEPYVTGGNPILADEDVLFNDLLGSTIGIRSGKEYRETGMTAFGETDEKSAMFTGKPYIGELGYAFLFRNYRPGLGKWQTSDPLDYPDGWNNLAYVNNMVINCFDYQGLNIYQIHDKEGAGGAGHSAWVAKKSNGKYQAIDFNPKGKGIRNQEFNSLGDAINYLNQDNNRYESYLEFPTTPQHGSDFVDKINEYISNGYSLDDNNCYTTGAEAYNETNPDPYGTMLHTGNTPNYSYARNRQNGGIRHVIE